MIVARTSTVIPFGDEKRNQARDSRTLAGFRDTPAYVLLGDPGSGKTTAFETEKEALGADACLISARDLLALDAEMHAEWRNRTLFIDGLDEVRAGAADARTPFDSIRNRLETLRRPRFRLSCREADWLGENDWQHLTTVSKDNSVVVLRLDPLTELDIVRILEGKGVEYPQAFMENARERRIDGLLQNPLTLELLATVIARSGQWPESRLQTFEEACLHLVREHNREHKAVKRPLNLQRLLEAAGRLCAVQLISGIEGYTQGQGDPDTDCPSLEEIQFENPELLQSVLSTKLFKADSGSFSRFAPIHRHVAEFLGARYLARLIEDGLPARRVLSLITGEDGIVVTGLRSLSAWLAAYCKSARSELIIRDPVGVGLYGDIRGFSFDEKRALLNALHSEVSRLGSIQLAAAFGPLATPDMEPALRNVLANASRDNEHQTFVSFVLRFLREGSPMRGLSGLLLEIVRDETRWPRVNMSALNAFIHCEEETTVSYELKMLLKDIQDGIVADPDNELLGILLWHLYPQELTPNEVWSYVRSTSDQSRLIGYYKLFWMTGLNEKSTDQQVVELLHALCEPRSGLNSDPVKVHLHEDFPLRLLARGLHVHGDQLDSQHLYDWLDAGLSGDFDNKEALGEIRAWLTTRAEIQKQVIIEGLKRCPQSDDFRYRAFNVHKRLYGADPPLDLGRWCLNQAVEMTGANPMAAEHLLEVAWRSYTEGRGNKGLSLELLKEHSRNHIALMSVYLDQLGVPGSNPRGDRVEDRDGRKARYIDQRRRQENKWFEFVRSNETALRENRAAPVLLHEIARTYFGNFLSFNADDAPKAIQKRLRGDHDLIDAALEGLRGAIKRDDIPNLQEIIGIREKGRMHALCWPFLAGMAEAEREATVDLSQWDKERIRTAITFYFCIPHGEYRPEWYEWLLKRLPQVVADVQVQFAVSELRNGRHSIYKLWELAHDPAHAVVARVASMRLLRSFPTRCNTEQINALDDLLWAALRYADRTLLCELIDRKLATKSMGVSQRVHWLAVASIVSPETYTEHLIDYVEGQENRIRQFVGFLPDVISHAGGSLSDINLGVRVLEVFVRLIGGYVGPHQRWDDESDDDKGGRVGPEMQSAWLANSLIQRLARTSGDSASVALDRLLENNTLSAWHDVLSRARDFQRVIQRDASYNHPEIHDVCRTLDNGNPANAADLAALVTDHLHEIARNIHDGSTSDWRQYWENPSDEETRKPKHEELCRDALLSDLKYKLAPLPIDAQPEGRYADDKRADIRLCFEDFNVPVEIKKNEHPDLWSAIKTQLIAKYTRDPGAAGHGIYLVFWFGKAHTRFHPSGRRPETPDELQKQLKATLSEEETLRISVRVINVSGEDADWREN